MGSAGMNLSPAPWIWMWLLFSSHSFTLGEGSDPKTGQQDDWGRGHLFRSGRSGYIPITRGYLRTFSSPSNNHPFDASSNSNYERNSGFDIPIHKNVEYNLYNKERDRRRRVQWFHKPIRIFCKRSGWKKRLFGGKHMMRSGQQIVGLISFIHHIENNCS